MIKKLTINSYKDIPLPHWKEHSALTSLKEISFDPGVNILYGKNKSGKSSILKLIAKFFFADESGKSNICSTGYRVIHPYLYEVLSEKEKVEKRALIPKSVSIEHDGQGIGYGNFFPQDRFSKTPSFDSFFAQFPPRQRISITHDSHIIEADWKLAETFFNSSTMVLGAPTLLLDAPETGMDMIEQFSLWEKLSQVKAEDYQLIIATNSAFALDISGFHYIELTPGFYDMSKHSVSAWANSFKRD